MAASPRSAASFTRFTRAAITGSSSVRSWPLTAPTALTIHWSSSAANTSRSASRRRRIQEFFMLEGVDRIVDLAGPKTSGLVGAGALDVLDAVKGCDVERLAATDGHFAATAR